MKNLTLLILFFSQFAFANDPHLLFQAILQSGNNPFLNISAFNLNDLNILNFTDPKNGKTPLHLAAEKNDLSLIEELLDHHASIKRDLLQKFPLHYAVEHGFWESGRLLVLTKNENLELYEKMKIDQLQGKAGVETPLVLAIRHASSPEDLQNQKDFIYSLLIIGEKHPDLKQQYKKALEEAEKKTNFLDIVDTLRNLVLNCAPLKFDPNPTELEKIQFEFETYGKVKKNTRSCQPHMNLAAKEPKITEKKSGKDFLGVSKISNSTRNDAEILIDSLSEETFSKIGGNGRTLLCVVDEGILTNSEDCRNQQRGVRLDFQGATSDTPPLLNLQIQVNGIRDGKSTVAMVLLDSNIDPRTHLESIKKMFRDSLKNQTKVSAVAEAITPPSGQSSKKNKKK